MEDTLNWLEEEKERIFSIEREAENAELRKYLVSQMDLIERVFMGDEDYEEIRGKLEKYLRIGKERSENCRKRMFELSDMIKFRKENFNNDQSFDERHIMNLLERADILSTLNEHNQCIKDSEAVLVILEEKSDRCVNTEGNVDNEEISDLKRRKFRKEACFRLSFSYNGKRDFKNGLDWSKKALEIDNEYVDAMVQYGRSKYRVEGTLQESLSIADKCIELNPAHHLSHWLRSSLLEQLHRSNEAIEEVERMNEIDPYHPWTLLQLASIYDELKVHTESVKYYTYSIALDPRDPLFYYNRGYSLKRVKKNFALAYSDFTMALILDHADIEAWNNRGIILSEEMESLSDAERDFTCAIHFKPTHSNSFYNRGVIREGLGLIEDSFDDFTEAIRLKPDSDVYYYRAYVCFNHMFVKHGEEKYLKIALSDILKYQELLPKDEDGEKLRKLICTSALEFYSKMLEETNPFDTSTLQGRADAYRGLGMEKEMKKDLGMVSTLMDLKERYKYLLLHYGHKFFRISLLSDQKIDWFKILLKK